MIKRTLLCVVTLLLVAISPSSPEENEWKILKVDQSAWVARGGAGTWVTLKSGDSLRPGDKLEVKSGGADLGLNAGGQRLFYVSPGSRVQIPAQGQKQIYLESGNLFVWSSPEAVGRFSVLTPHAACLSQTGGFKVEVQTEKLVSRILDFEGNLKVYRRDGAGNLTDQFEELEEGTKTLVNASRNEVLPIADVTDGEWNLMKKLGERLKPYWTVPVISPVPAPAEPVKTPVAETAKKPPQVSVDSRFEF